MTDKRTLRAILDELKQLCVYLEYEVEALEQSEREQ